MKHVEDLRKAIARNKNSGNEYEITVDKYSNYYKVVEGPDFLKGLKSGIHGYLTSNTSIIKVEKKKAETIA